jgi:hypothetical protein
MQDLIIQDLVIDNVIKILKGEIILKKNNQDKILEPYYAIPLCNSQENNNVKVYKKVLTNK